MDRQLWSHGLPGEQRDSWRWPYEHRSLVRSAGGIERKLPRCRRHLLPTDDRQRHLAGDGHAVFLDELGHVLYVGVRVSRWLHRPLRRRVQLVWWLQLGAREPADPTL